MSVEFLVLGPVEALRDRETLALGGMQQRRLLAVLLSASGQIVSLDRLEETVWPNGDAPDGARRTLLTYVSRLRAALGDGFVATRDSGYALDVGGDLLDSAVFEGLVESARTAAPTLRLALLDQALTLWRGAAFGEFANEWWARPIAARLEEVRLVAHEDRIDALLELGEADRAVSDAEGFAAAYPLRERPVAQLMRALVVSGRQAEAMRAYQAFREQLIEQTGLEPSPSLVELERSIAAGSIPEPRTSGRFARGYVLGDVLGEGSFGTVYRATQPGVGREVAVKVIRAELADDPAFAQRFEAEAQLVARLEHPHIVALYDFWREPGGAYLVFRLMRGGSAEQRLITDGAWSLDRVTQVVEQIGGALAAAHAAGVVHRDVKPANVLFDDGGHAHLADFGIASTGDAVDGGSLYSAGSPLYASPEQFQRLAVSARSDIYSLGAMVWELLAGVPPFDGESATKIGRTKLERPVPSLSHVRPDLAATIDAVLQKATAVDPIDRFATASELVLAWRAAIDARRFGTTDDNTSWRSSAPHEAAQTMTGLATAGVNPYKGLRSFSEADARDFFGRAALVDELAAVVGASRVTMVVGASGSGKSSLVHAGLLPRLRSGGARIVTMVPTDRPCAQLHNALLAVAINPLAPKVEHAVEFVADEATSDLVIVVDQFEEVWTLADSDERDRFVALLKRLVTDESLNVRLVCAIRADFYDRPLSEPEFGPVVAKHAFSVAPMTAAELSEAVRAPANVAGVSFEPGLDAEIVADVVNQSASLPMLQFALAELYEQRRGAVIPTAAYREMGGVAGAVAARAEAVFTGLGDGAQRDARRLFSRLITPGAGAEDTRRRARRSELPDTVSAVADQFVTHRLLVVDRDPATREPTVDIAHEALLTRWPRLRGWLDEDREQLQLMQHLSRAADEWDSAGRRESELYRGPRLSIVGEVNETGNVILAPVEAEFLSASRTAQQIEQHAEATRVAQQARQNTRLRRALVAAAAMLVVAVLAGSIALVQRSRADDQRDAAVLAQGNEATARKRADLDRLIAQSRADAVFSPERGLLLAVEAYRRSESRADKLQAAGAIQSAFSQQPKGYLGAIEGEGPYKFANHGSAVIVAMNLERMSVWDATTWKKKRDIAVDTNVTGLTLSADDRYVAITTPDHVSVYAVATGAREAELNVGFRASGVIFHPTDSDRVVLGRMTLPPPGAAQASDPNPVVQILNWRANRSDVEIALPAPVFHNQLSPDGRVLVTGHNGDGMVRMWDAHTGALLAGPLVAGTGAGLYTIIGLSNFSPDGTMIASHNLRGTVRVWSVPSGQLVTKLDLRPAPSVGSVAFVDGDRILYTKGDLYEYNLSTAALRVFSGAKNPINGTVGLNPSRSTAALAGYLGTTDEAIHIVALDGRQAGARRSLPLPPGFTIPEADNVDRLSVNTTGTQLLAFGTQAHMLDLSNPTAAWRVVDLPGEGVLTRASFTRDGRFIVTQHHDGKQATVSLWDPAGLRTVATVAIPATTFEFRFSRDYRLLATTHLEAGRNKSVVHVYDVASGVRTKTLTDFENVGGAAAVVAIDLSFSADAKRLAAGTLSGTNGLVWDLDTGSTTVINNALYLEFDRAGRYLVTMSLASKVVYLLDAVTLTTPADLQPIAGRVSVRPSSHPTEPLLITDTTCELFENDVGSIMLFDTEAGREIGTGFELNCGFWFPDGNSFMGKDGKTIQIWDTDPEKWVEAACRFAGRNLTEDEWKRYGPQAPYRKTCGE